MAGTTSSSRSSSATCSVRADRGGESVTPRRASLLLSIALALTSVLACAPNQPARRDVVLGLAGEPRAIMDDEPSAQVIRTAVTEALVRRDRDGEFEPRLAVEVPTLANGGVRIVTDEDAPSGRLIATFELRDGARWQDGTPITSADVRYAFDEDRSAPPGTARRWIAERVDRVEPIDDRRVRFVYRAGERWDLYPLAPSVLPAHVLLRATAEQRALYQREPMHAGPFAVAAWVPGFGLTLSAFKGYALGPPALGRIEVRFYPDRGAVVDALRRGEIDVAASPAVEADLARTVDSFADAASLQPHYTPAMSMELLRFGVRGTAFADPRVRAAVELAVDRAGLVDALFAGRPRVPRSYLVPPLWAATEALPVPRVDREGARSLLAAAGFRPAGLGVLERGDARMTPALLVAGGSRSRVEAARRVAGDLATIGIAATVVERPLAEVRDAVSRGDFDIVLLPQRVDDPQLGSEAYRGLVDPWYDVLLGAAAAASERAEKRVLYAELQRLWAGALPGLPLYQHLLVDVAPRALEGVQPSPSGDALTWNAHRWRFLADVN